MLVEVEGRGIGDVNSQGAEHRARVAHFELPFGGQGVLAYGHAVDIVFDEMTARFDDGGIISSYAFFALGALGFIHGFVVRRVASVAGLGRDRCHQGRKVCGGLGLGVGDQGFENTATSRILLLDKILLGQMPILSRIDEVAQGGSFRVFKAGG